MPPFPPSTKEDIDGLKGKGDETERENKESQKQSRCDLHDLRSAITCPPCVGHQPGYRGLVNRMMYRLPCSSICLLSSKPASPPLRTVGSRSKQLTPCDL